MKLIRKIAAVFIAAAMTAAAFTAVPASADNSTKTSSGSSSQLTIVRTSPGKFQKDGWSLDQFTAGGMYIDELYWFHPVKDDVTFGESEFYRLTAEALRKFKKTGELRFKRVTVDEKLKDFCAYDAVGGIFIGKDVDCTLVFDPDTNTLSLNNEVGKDMWLERRFYRFIDGSNVSIQSEYPLDSRENTNKVLYIDKDGNQNLAEIKFHNYIINENRYIFAVTYSGNSAKLIMVDLDNNMEVTKLKSFKDVHNIELMGCTQDLQYLYYLIVTRDESGAMKDRYIARFSFKTGENKILKHIDDNKSIYTTTMDHIDENGDDCAFFFVTDKDASSADHFFKGNISTGKFTKIMLPEKLDKVLYTRFPFTDRLYVCGTDPDTGSDKVYVYNYKTGEFTELPYGGLGSVGLGITVNYEPTDEITGKLRLYDRNGNGLPVSNSALSFESIGSMISIGVPGTDDFITTNYLPVTSGGRAWFIDADLNRISNTVKADYVATVGFDLYLGYNKASDKWFLMTLSDTYEAAPGKVEKVYTEVSGTEICARWNMAYKGEFYRIDIREKGGKWKLICYTEATAAHLTDLGLKPGTTYELRVRAGCYDTTGEKALFSKAATATFTTGK